MDEVQNFQQKNKISNNLQYVVIALFVVLLLMTSLGVFYFTKSQSRGKDNISQVQKTQPSPTIVPTKEITHIVEGVSLHKNYNLVFLHKEEVVKIFENWQIFDKTSVVKDGQSTSGRPIELIQFAIRDKKPNRPPTYRNNTYILLFPGIISIDYVMTDAQINSVGIKELILKQFLKDVYTTAFPEAVEKSVDDKVNTAYKTLLETYSEYFQIQKKSVEIKK